MFDGDPRDFGSGGDDPFPTGSGPKIGTVEGIELLCWSLFAASMAAAIVVTLGYGIIGSLLQ